MQVANSNLANFVDIVIDDVIDGIIDVIDNITVNTLNNAINSINLNQTERDVIATLRQKSKRSAKEIAIRLRNLKNDL